MNQKTLKEKIILGLKFLKKKSLNLASEGNIVSELREDFISHLLLYHPKKLSQKT